MKLRNKKTGAIGEFFCSSDPYMGEITLGVEFENGGTVKYDSLSKMAEEWEDYEEPKDFWYIDDFAIMCGTEGEFTTPDLGSFTKRDIEKLKQIGNYFETKEQAEKAVEKLKAWQRLSENKYLFGKFIDLIYSLNGNSREFNEYMDDILLIFGGEE